MSIRIDSAKCISCKACTRVCPGNLIYINDDGKAYMKYPKDCWGCTACIKECNVGAIQYYLGADIGGKGASLNVKKEKKLLHWNISKANGEKIVITINGEEANKY